MSSFLLSLFKKKKRPPAPKGSGSSSNGKPREMSFGLARVINYEELKEATNNFDTKRELGNGGFGRVYLGKLRDGQMVAVKVLFDRSPRRLEQFFNEVTVLSRIRHKNLVTLYGCTNPNGQELLLVYEFVPNGTVADHIHGPRPALTWALRVQIAIQTAEALTYLHAREPPIIHRDVKTDNILLDNDFRVKVADLGLCRLLPWDTTHVSTAPQGTMGYRDPDYDRTFRLTDKSDVYSFGVLLVELISGKQAVDVNRAPDNIYLAGLAINMIINKMLDEFVDPKLGYHSNNDVRRMINSVAELALECLRPTGSDRPPMVEILKVLRGIKQGREPIHSNDRGLNEDDVKGRKQARQPIPGKDRESKEVNVRKIKPQKQQIHGKFLEVKEVDAQGIKHDKQQMVSGKDKGLKQVDPRGIKHDNQPINVKYHGIDVISDACVFSYTELQKATNSFDPLRALSDGSVNEVYRGKLQDGKAVAVKVLYDRNSERLMQKFNDIKVISGLRHENLLRLYGSTKPRIQDREMLLVHEYAPNGILVDHLRGQRQALNLAVRIQIAMETAKAIAYLHSLEPPIVHLYVKTYNILLDSSFHVKVSGLRRLQVPSAAQGISCMNDVYNFGVLLLELISEKQTEEVNQELREDCLVNMALKNIKNKELEKLVDPKLGYGSHGETRKMINSVSKLAFWCLEPKGNISSMVDVLRILKGIVDETQVIVKNVTISSPKNIQKSSDHLVEEVGRVTEACIFSYKELREATNSFDPTLELSGRDVNKIYLGNLRDGRTVTVKVLSNRNLEQLEKLFNEVKVHSRLRHENLVTLYGSTNTRCREMLLVYQYVPNAETVANNLRGEGRALDWDVRIKIAIETAEALSYLHSLETPIIHSNLTTYTILLDASFNVKISGLSLYTRWTAEKRVGQKGYVDPEYKRSQHFKLITDKIDVYSFGVVLLELVSGRPAFDANRDEQYLATMALNKKQKNALSQLVDKKLDYRWKGKIISVAELACRCLVSKADRRPLMVEVLSALKEILDNGKQVDKGN